MRKPTPHYLEQDPSPRSSTRPDCNPYSPEHHPTKQTQEPTQTQQRRNRPEKPTTHRPNCSNTTQQTNREIDHRPTPKSSQQPAHLRPWRYLLIPRPLANRPRNDDHLVASMSSTPRTGTVRSGRGGYVRPIQPFLYPKKRPITACP